MHPFFSIGLFICCVFLILFIIHSAIDDFSSSNKNSVKISENRLKKNPNLAKYDKTDGTYDEVAKKILKKINKKKHNKKNSSDFYLGAKIRSDNVLDRNFNRNNINVARDIVMNIGGAVNALENEFNGGRQIMDHNVVLPDAANIIDNIHHAFVFADATDMRNAGGIGAPYINLNQFREEDQLIRDIMNVRNMIDNTPVVKQDREQKLANAIKTANNKQDVVGNFTKSLINHRSDSQNTHDASVSMAVANTYRVLGEDMKGVPISKNPISDIRKYINNIPEKDLSIHGRKNALRTLNEIANIEGYSAGIGAKEKDILARVWNRSNHPNNKDNSDNMRLSLVMGLADAATTTGTVCTNGRVNRMLESVTLLDFNKNAGNANTINEIKNNIYTDTHKMISGLAAELTKSDNNELRAVGESYTNPKIQTTENGEKTFKIMVEKNVDEIIAQYKDVLPEREIKKIKEDCMAAV